MGSKVQLSVALVISCVFSAGFASLYGDTTEDELALLEVVQIGPQDRRFENPPDNAPFDVPTLAMGNIALDWGPDGIQNTLETPSADDNAVPFGSRTQDGRHAFLNNGEYGGPWNGNTGTASTEVGGVLESCGAVHCAHPSNPMTPGALQCSYGGIYWTDGPVTIAEIALGSNNQRDFQALDITQRNFVIQYTTDTFTPIAIRGSCIGDNPPCDDSSQVSPAVNWITVGIANAHLRGRSSAKTWRHRYRIDPALTNVRAIRILKVQNDHIDEIEIGNAANALGPEPSTDLVLKETGGPYTTPAATGDVPTADESNLARHPDVTVFASSQAGIANLNDGNYGTAWVGASGAYAGIYFDDVAFPADPEPPAKPLQIQEVAMGRDNTGVLTDMINGALTIEYVPATDSFNPASATEVDEANWIRPALHLASAHLDAGTSCQGLRHRYKLLLPVKPRAIRVVAAPGDGLALDEFEVGPIIAADLDTALTPLGGFMAADLETEPQPFGDVPGPNRPPGPRGGPNIARAADAVPFAALSVFSAHTGPGNPILRLRDGNYDDANGWNGHSSVVTTPRSFASYAGLYWTDGLVRIDEIRESRDNDGCNSDRHDGAFAVQYTTDQLDFEFGGEDEPSVAKAQWIPIGTLRDHPLDPMPNKCARTQSTSGIPGVMDHPPCMNDTDTDMDGDTDCDDISCTCGMNDLLQYKYTLTTPVVARAIRISSWPTQVGGTTIFDELLVIGEAVEDEAPPGGCNPVSPGGLQLPGNANQDTSLDLSDVVTLLGFLFQGNPASLPCSTDAANLAFLDVNTDTAIDLSDGIFLLAFLFQGGPPPDQGQFCIPIVDCPPNPACP